MFFISCPFPAILFSLATVEPLTIVTYPHPALRHICKPILRIDEQVHRWIDEMFSLMYGANGIGLAANQVNLPYQLFVMNVSGNPAQTDLEWVFVNPVIQKHRFHAEDEEGCLSFPEINASVIRHAELHVEAVSRSGEMFRQSLKGMNARVVQHEMDHLRGVCFVDRLTEDVETEVSPRLAEMTRQFEDCCQRGTQPAVSDILARLAGLEKERCE